MSAEATAQARAVRPACPEAAGGGARAEEPPPRPTCAVVQPPHVALAQAPVGVVERPQRDAPLEGGVDAEVDGLGLGLGFWGCWVLGDGCWVMAGGCWGVR